MLPEGRRAGASRRMSDPSSSRAMRIQILLGLSILATTPLAAQTTGPEHTGYDPTVVYSHSHNGPLGEKLRFLEESLKCSCGCTLDLHTCQLNMQCGISPAWSQRILAQLEEGRTEEQILDGFVADYGKAVLIAPPLEGFNWVGYLTPAMALLMGGALVGMVLKRNTRASGVHAEVGTPVSDADWDRLQAEIRKIEDEEAASGW